MYIPHYKNFIISVPHFASCHIYVILFSKFYKYILNIVIVFVLLVYLYPFKQNTADSL